MSTSRDAKAAVVDDVRSRLETASATVVTEYRGLTVAEMAALRRALRAVGGDYKVFKNTLVRRAVEGSGFAGLAELLEGPTAIAFVTGDVSAVAKALRDFARGAPALVLKGGVFEGSLLGARELAALADLPSREVLLAQFAGALAAPMRTMAGLLKALPQNLAYGLAALLAERGGERQTATDVPADASATAGTAAAEADGEVPAGEVPADEVPADEVPAADEAGGDEGGGDQDGNRDEGEGIAAGEAGEDAAEAPADD